MPKFLQLLHDAWIGMPLNGTRSDGWLSGIRFFPPSSVDTPRRINWLF